MQVTVNNIGIIWNRMEAMMNQQTVDAAVDAACVRYACDEVVRILNLSENEYYVPSSGLILHILRWLVIALEGRLGYIHILSHTNKLGKNAQFLRKAYVTSKDRYITFRTCPDTLRWDNELARSPLEDLYKTPSQRNGITTLNRSTTLRTVCGICTNKPLLPTYLPTAS